MSKPDLVLPAAVVAGQAPAACAPRPLSVFDIFRVGIGPSSSHTVGPMRAAFVFARRLTEQLAAPAAPTLGRVTVDLYGSLGATGRGHATDRAVLLGLAGHKPESVSSAVVAAALPHVGQTGTTPVAGREIPFSMEDDVRFLPGTCLDYHVNGLRLTALTPAGEQIAVGTFYSVGGGFVMEEGPDGQYMALASETTRAVHAIAAPYPFSTADELLTVCERAGLGVADIVRANEEAARSATEVDAYLDHIRAVMEQCIEDGCSTQGVLPGGLNVTRRAAALRAQLTGRRGDAGASWQSGNDPLAGIDWVNLYALAVNEENAAGHRVVTAPTNGAAGVVPAVLQYYLRFVPGASDAGARRFLLAATAIGALIKTNASIAGAEVGCQGEVGSASAMAAGGLADALGGTARQVENAAEIAMEHSLGLTCDPVAGLVQIPCIERNAIAAVKAINAARMALWGDGRHAVSLDTVIETMRQTGVDMLSKYKETSLGGLAVNVVEC